MGAEPIDQLLSELESRAATEVEAILANARSEAKRLLDDAHAATEKRQAAALEHCDRAAAEELRTSLGEARRAGRGELLEAQHAFVDRVLARAKLDAAPRLLDAANLPHIVARIQELAAFIPGAVDIQCPSMLVAALQSSLRHQPQLRPTPAAGNEIGFICIGEGGRVRIDDTVDSWLQATRAQQAIRLCRAIDTPNGASR